MFYTSSLTLSQPFDSSLVAIEPSSIAPIRVDSPLDTTLQVNHPINVAHYPETKIIKRDLKSFVGFANLPNQWHRKSIKKGFNLNVMVVGMCFVLILISICFCFSD